MPAKNVHSVQVANETHEWLQALAENGLLVTIRGKPAAHPQVAKLVEALHAVLAGGEVAVKVTRRGDPKLKKALDAKLKKAMSASARLAGDPKVLVP
jgi:hypothetical protein